MDVHASWKVYVFRELRFAFDCGANLISTPSLHFQGISKSSQLDFCGADLSIFVLISETKDHLTLV